MGFHETIAAGESERFEGFGAELAAIQKRRDEKASLMGRALHVKAHAGVKGSFVVEAAEPHRVGVFAEPGHKYPVYVRFSNGSMRSQGDKAPDARGFALKLVGVPGKKIIPGLEDAQTQDFLFIGDPSLPFVGPDEFMAFIRSAQSGPLLLPFKLIGQLGFGRARQIIGRALKNAKITSFANAPFHTGAPIAFGATAAKLGLFPIDGQRASGLTNGVLHDDIGALLKKGPLSWKLRAQLFVDDAQTPIEDASVTWTGPWVDLGTLTIDQQDIDSSEGQGRTARVDTFSFDPWHAVEAHRPLGAIMRARAVAYRVSVLARKAAAEPATVE